MENITKTNIIYARLTILVLTINCILTGYMIFSLTKIQTDAFADPLVLVKARAK